MIINLFFSALFISVTNPGDSLMKFHKQLAWNIELNMAPTPESNSRDTCYHYTELLKVEINKYSKVVSLELSDGAPDWLKNDINNQKKKKRIDFKKLDSLALKANLKNCILVFPFIIESEDFPCGLAKKKRSLNQKYFQFGNKSLKGNIIFCEEIRCIIPTNYKSKTSIIRNNSFRMGNQNFAS